MSGPFTVDGQINYYVRELSVSRQCDDSCRTTINKDLYWVYDSDDAYETDAAAKWIVVSYRVGKNDHSFWAKNCKLYIRLFYSYGAVLYLNCRIIDNFIVIVIMCVLDHVWRTAWSVW